MTPPVSKAPKRSVAQMAADAAFIENYAVMGKTEHQIAELLSIERAKCDPPYSLSRSQVRNDLMKIRKEWLAESQHAVADYVAAELKGLQRQEDELWKAWAASQKNSVIKTTEKTLDEQKEEALAQAEAAAATSPQQSKRKSRFKIGRITIKSEEQTGQAAYMNLILECRNQRRALLGLDQPKRTILQDPQGNAPSFIIRLTEDEVP